MTIIDIVDEIKLPVVDIDIFKCCMHEGKYLGDLLLHNPDIPGDGPWFLVITQDGVSTTFGYGTKREALDAMDNLTRDSNRRYEIDIDPWD